MIYVFEGENQYASVVYDARYLSEETKEKAIKITKLPKDESAKGQQAILKANKQTGEVWYEYEDIPKTDEEIQQEKIQELEQQLAGLQSAMAELTMMLSTPQ